MASTYLTRTQGTPTNIDKYTFSVWVKRADIGAGNSKIFSVSSGSAYGEEKLEFNQDDLIWRHTDTSGSTTWQRVTNRKFRDSFAWYHILVAYDSSLGTAADRCKMYINGVQETSFSGSSNPSQNADTYINKNNSTVYIARLHSSGSQYFGGSMSHMHFIDGTAYTPSTFGSTDATTGEWKINTSPSVTYGNNGFFILKDGNSVTDQSGNSNNFTVSGGTLTKTEDCPSNVFSTLDDLQRKTSALTYSNGSTTVSFPGAWVFALGNTGVSSGKYYWEAKCNSGNNANSYFGICAEMVPAGNGFYNNSQNGAIMYKVGGGETYIDGSYNSSGYSPSINNTDTVGLALDLDSGTKTLKIYKNGTLLTSGGTINLSSYYDNTLIFPCFSGNSSSASCSFNVNFGNGYFGTTAVSSAGTNASGLGIFEYDVPSGYTAICTKGLNE